MSKKLKGDSRGTVASAAATGAAGTVMSYLPETTSATGGFNPNDEDIKREVESKEKRQKDDNERSSSVKEEATGDSGGGWWSSLGSAVNTLATHTSGIAQVIREDFEELAEEVGAVALANKAMGAVEEARRDDAGPSPAAMTSTKTSSLSSSPSSSTSISDPTPPLSSSASSSTSTSNLTQDATLAGEFSSLLSWGSANAETLLSTAKDKLSEAAEAAGVSHAIQVRDWGKRKM